VKVESPPLVSVPPRKRDAIIQKWLARTLQTYPGQTSRFLLQNKDPFCNPVGRALREGLPALFDALVAGVDAAKTRPVLDEIVRIRAVQEFTASQAVAFIFFLKEVVREELEPGGRSLAVLESRIDEMALLAFDLYTQCRERICEIKANEAKRRVYLLERVAASRERPEPR
jgi:hypothetical protein